MPVTGKQHHCGYKSCNYQCGSRKGPGFCPKHQWACKDTENHGKGNKTWYMYLGQACGGRGKEAPQTGERFGVIRESRWKGSMFQRATKS